MSFIRIDINTTQAMQSIAQLEASIVAKLNIPHALDRGAAVLLNRTRQRYLGERDPDDVPWLPSKRGIKRRLRGGTGTLFDTGRLFRSIQLHKVGELDRTISTDVPYGKYHQNGQGQSLRRFLGFNEDDQKMFHSVVESMIQRAAAQINAGGL